MYVYYGHHKCASTWVWQIIDGVCRDIGISHRLVLDPLTPLKKGPLTDYRESFARSELLDYLTKTKAEAVSCIAADMVQAEQLTGHKAIHVIRDPRDIIVSAYFSHRNSHPVDDLPHLAEHRKQLRNCSLEEGLLREIDFSWDELNTLSEWNYNQHGILELKMEELAANPYNGFLKVFRHFGLMPNTNSGKYAEELLNVLNQVRNRLSTRTKLLKWLRSPMQASGQLVLAHVYRHRFEAKTQGRKRGEEDRNSHYRKGVHGDWVNYFTPKVLDVLGGQFNDLLITTGYERDSEWINNAQQELDQQVPNAVQV